MTDGLIARRDELLALAAFADDLPDGGQAMVLAGDAGIGKTTLWQVGDDRRAVRTGGR